MTSIADLDLLPLRTERQRLLGEVERLGWLRRLVVARRDVEVSRLAGFGAHLWPDDALPDVSGRPSSRTTVMAPGCSPRCGPASEPWRPRPTTTRRDLDRATGELVRRYREQPRLCLGAAGVGGR